MNEHARPRGHEGASMAGRHDRLRAMLPAFATACLSGDPSDRAWHELETHLDGCPACREELTDLIDLLEATAAGTLAPAYARDARTTHAAPPVPATQQPAELVAVVQLAAAGFRRILIEFTAALRAAMQQQRLDGQFRSLEPQAPSDDDDPTEGLPEEYRYELDSSLSDNISVAIDFALKDHERQLYEVKVTVIAPDRDPFLQQGHRVTLHYEAHTLVESTDASGCVAFRGIPAEALPQLQVTITPHPP